MHNDRLTLSRDQSITNGTLGLPVVGRYGLSHSLLAWARCELWCKDNGLPMLSPNWNHLRIGPYLRRERDKREYHRLFRFPMYIHGLRRAWLISSLPKRPAPAPGGVPIDISQPQLIVFKNRVTGNFEKHFSEVAGRATELLSALRLMTRPQYLPSGETSGHIAVHVRLGDFSTCPPESELRGGLRNARLPIQWYSESLTTLRKALGRQLPAVVFSDGEDADLAELLALPDVRRARQGAAVTDLLAMTQAAALISSGSGFSIWACFLGNIPRVCFPSQRQLRVLGEPSFVDLEPELDFGAFLSGEFAEAVNLRVMEAESKSLGF